MKHTTLRTIAMLGLFFMLAMTSVSAQSSVKMKVNIPFDFAAGNVKLKAGEYTIKPSGRILVLRADKETKAVFVLVPYLVQRTERDLSGQLVFHQYGNDYFLAEAWTSGETTGFGVNESGAERRVARELARTNTLRQTVAIAAQAY